MCVQQCACVCISLHLGQKPVLLAYVLRVVRIRLLNISLVYIFVCQCVCLCGFEVYIREWCLSDKREFGTQERSEVQLYENCIEKRQQCSSAMFWFSFINVKHVDLQLENILIRQSAFL